MLLGIVKTRYNTTNNLRNQVIDELNESRLLYDIISNLGDTSSVNYVQKYDTSNGLPIDLVDGSGDKDVYYFTSNNSNNLAGKNGNVIFGDYCWQIVRTTTTGGVKLIYNGPKTEDNKCPSDAALRSKPLGVVTQNSTNPITITGSKIYGTSFEIYKDGDTNKFRLLHTNTYSWSDSTYQNISGKFVCGTSSSPTGTSDTCTVLYYVGDYVSSTEVNYLKLTINTVNNYSVIGESGFGVDNKNLAYVGYMYNDTYLLKNYPLFETHIILQTTYLPSSQSYYYGTTAVWNSTTGEYELKVDDGNGNSITPTSTTTLNSYGDNYQGLYTCKSSTATSCSTVYYIVAKSSSSYSYIIQLSNNENINSKTNTWTYGTGYTKSGNTYTLTGTTTKTFKVKDWYTDYSQYKNIYLCSDYTSTTCSEIYYIKDAYNYRFIYNTTNKDYIYGNSVTYSNGTYTINTDSNPDKYHSIWLWDSNHFNKIKSSHYTCFQKDSNICSSVYYIVNVVNSDSFKYIELKNGDNINIALNKMVNYDNSNVSTLNKYNSPIKGVIESWYEKNLLQYSSYLDENEVYCNDRSISDLGTWNPTDAQGYLYFTRYRGGQLGSLSCNNVTDRFSQTNELAKLKYPIGLLTMHEFLLMKKEYLKTGASYWVMTPNVYTEMSVSTHVVGATGDHSNSSSNVSTGVRPVITLKAGVEVSGTGTYNNPYYVDTTARADVELRSITITAERQEINRGLQISSSTKRVTVSATYDGESGLRAGDRLQSIRLTPSTDQVVTDGTIMPSNALILDADGNDVTRLYDITYNTGQLVIVDTVLSGDPYTIEYYLGNGTSTAGATKIGTTSCVYPYPCALKTFESFDVIFPYSEGAETNRGWSFYGWTNTESGTSRKYEDGDSINPGTYSTTVRLYAIGRKSYRFNSGIEPKSYTTKYQYWNPVSLEATHRTAIDIPTPKDLSAAADGSWTFIGYVGGSNYAGGTDVHIGANVVGTSYNPIIDTGSTGLMRSKYKRTLTVHYNANGGSGTMADSTLVQVYNSGTGSADGSANSGSTLGPYTITLKNNTFTKTDYIFKNWTENSTSGTAYAGGASYNKLGATIKSTTLESTMYAAWLKSSYEIKFNYHESQAYDDDEYLNTGYKINWGRDFKIEVNVKYSTTGVRHLIIGNYASGNAKNLNIEINTSNKLRLYMGNGAVDKASSVTLPTGKTITVTFTWKASTSKYTLTATADGMTDISMSGTQTMSGTAPNTLMTNRDHRGTGTFKKISISNKLIITDTRATNSALSDLPSMSKSGYTYKGWYTAASGGTKITSTKTVTADATYHVQWKTWTRKTYNCTKGTWSSSPTETRVQTCTARTKSSADSNNYSTYWTCEQLGIAGAAHSICDGAGLVAPCYRKATYSRTGCSTYSSSATTETGVPSCSASTGSLKKVTCTEE
jgi:hypothetical protein